MDKIPIKPEKYQAADEDAFDSYSTSPSLILL